MVQSLREQVPFVYGELGPYCQRNDLEGCRWKFPPGWTSQWDIGEDEIIPENNLSPYEDYIMGGQYIALSKLNTDTSTSGRKSDEKAAVDTVVLKTKKLK